MQRNSEGVPVNSPANTQSMGQQMMFLRDHSMSWEGDGANGPGGRVPGVRGYKEGQGQG